MGKAAMIFVFFAGGGVCSGTVAVEMLRAP